MNVRHSDLTNDFISFWFDSLVDGKLQYRTFLDYMSSSWKTVDLMNAATVLEGKIDREIGLENENQEIQRIREKIQQDLIK